MRFPPSAITLLAALWATAGCHPGAPSASLGEADLAARAAHEDGTVHTYGMPDSYGGYRSVFESFEHEYGVRRLDINMSSTAVLERLREERDEPAADLVVVGALHATAAVDEGLVDCVGLEAADAMPAAHVGRGDDGCVHWIDTFTGTLAFMVNREVIDDPPRRWTDLLRPDLVDKVSFMDPRASATGVATLLAAARALGGSPEDPEPGIELLCALAEAGGMDHVMQRQDYDGFLRGTRPILINYGYNADQLRETHGIRCTAFIPEDGTVRMPYTTLLIRDRPHPWSGRLLMQYLHSPDGQRALGEGHVTPLRLGRGTVPLTATGQDVDVWDIERERVAPELDAMRRAFGRAIAQVEARAR